MEGLKQCDCSNIANWDEFYKPCLSTFTDPNVIDMVNSSDFSRTSISLSVVCSCFCSSPFPLVVLSLLPNSHL